jgi:hypothetical protein
MNKCMCSADSSFIRRPKAPFPQFLICPPIADNHAMQSATYYVVKVRTVANLPNNSPSICVDGGQDEHI